MPVIKCNGKDYAGSDVDLKDKVVTFESGDGLEPTGPAEVPLMESGWRVKNLMRSISLAVRNTRYLLKVLGTTDISALADGTLTGAVKGLADDKLDKAGGDVGGALWLKGGSVVHTVNNPENASRAIRFATIDFLTGYGDMTLEFKVAARLSRVTATYYLNFQAGGTPSSTNLASFMYDGSSMPLRILKEADAKFGLYVICGAYATYAVTGLHNPIPASARFTFEKTVFNKTPDGTIAPTNVATVLTGDVTGTSLFDAGSGNTVIQTQRRGCIAGRASSTAPGNWHKVASIDSSTNYNDQNIVFLVGLTYAGSSASRNGVLKLHFRTSAESFADLSLVWEYADSGIDVSNFVVVGKLVDSYRFRVELYCRVLAGYETYSFDVLSETKRVDRRNDWILFDMSAGIAELPSGYTVVGSTLATVQNPVKNVASIFVASYSGASDAFSFKFAVNDPNSDHRVPVLVIIGTQIAARTTMVPLTLLGLTGKANTPQSLPEGIVSVVSEGHVVTIKSHSMRYANFMVLYDGSRSSIEKA